MKRDILLIDSNANVCPKLYTIVLYIKKLDRINSPFSRFFLNDSLRL